MSPLHRRILSRVSSHPERSLLADLSEGTSRLMAEGGEKEKLGVLMDLTAAEYLAEGSCGRLRAVGRLADGHFAFAFHRGSGERGRNLNVVFSMELQRLRDRGMLEVGMSDETLVEITVTDSARQSVGQVLKERWWRADSPGCSRSTGSGDSGGDDSITEVVDVMGICFQEAPPPAVLDMEYLSEN